MARLRLTVVHQMFPWLKGLLRSVGSFWQDIWLPVYRIEHSGLTLICVGREAIDPYLNYLLFGDYVTGEQVGLVLLWRLGSAIDRWARAVDMVLLRTGRFRPPSAVTSRMLALPSKVRHLVELPPAEANLRGYFHNRATSRDLNRIEEAGFEYEITRDPSALHDFYLNFYVPFMEDRHREAADYPPWPVFKAIYGGMELMRVRKGGLIVAGGVRQEVEGTYRLMVRGVSKDPSAGFAGSALIWFSVIEAQRRRCRIVDLGTSRAFLKDGGLVYKKKWRSHIVMDELRHTSWCLPCGASATLYHFLEQNPFFCEHEGRLVGLVFLGEHAPSAEKELASLIKQCVFSSDIISIRIVLLTRDWATRSAALVDLLKRFPQTFHVDDLSRGSLAQLPDLLRGGSDVPRAWDLAGNEASSL